MKQKINYRLLFFGLTILLVSCTDYYEEGKERYNAKDYETALRYFKEVESADEHYDQSQVRIAEIDSILLQIEIEIAEEVRIELAKQDSLVALRMTELKKQGLSELASIETEFEQIGYYKGNSKNRVFTFYINSTKTISRDNIPIGLWNAIEEHGLKQMNTIGKTTQSFYYLTKQKAPDVTMYKTYDAAMNKAYDQAPVAVVYTQFNGEKGLLKKPED